MKTSHRLLVIALTLTLASCATMAPQTNYQKMGWEQREQKLTGIKGFGLSGKMAVRTSRDAFSASLQWQQQGPNYRIALFGPLGTHSYQITGQPGHVELAASNGHRTVDSSPEALLAKQAGWQLPLSDLYYWIRGVPVPNVPAQKELDSYNHLVLLKQDGWVIRYLDYTTVNNTDVPRKVYLNNPQLDVKIIVNEWQF